MTIVSKATWWDNLAAQFGFTNDGSTTIDSDVILTTLNDFFVDFVSQTTSTTFLAGFSSIVQPSSSKKNESNPVIPVNTPGDVVLGFGGYDFLAGTSSDNILHGGVGNDFFNPGGGIDLVIGGDEGTPAYERDTVGYMLATSGIVVEATDGGTPANTGLLPNQDVYSFSYADWVDPAIIKISEFEVGPNGDLIDISALLAAVGYTGNNPVGDGYIKYSSSSDGLKIQFDPDGNAGSQSGKELVRILGETINTFSSTHNLLTTPLPPPTGDENFLTYVSNDGFGSYDILFSVENIIGSTLNDVIHGHTVLANTLIGLAGNDSLFGEGGYDTLMGGAGQDTLYGGSGLDTIIIGKGGDQAYGGTEADLFKFDGTIGTDISGNTADIWDFQTGVGGDKVDVSEVLSAIGYTGNNPIADGYLQIVQSGADTHIKIDLDGAGVQTSQILAILHNTLANEVSPTANISYDAPKTLFVSILGQSNAEGLRVFGDDTESGVTRIKGGLEATTDYDKIMMTFKDEYGSTVMPAIGSTRVNGDYGGKADDSWWFPTANKPGEVLVRAVELMAVQLAAARAAGNVKPIFVWAQGESDAVSIGAQSTEAGKLAAQLVYKNATLAVFDYIKAHLGDDIEIYIVETGRYIKQAALNAGISEATADRTLAGLPYIRAAQEAIATERPDIHLAVKYTDLPMNYETDPLATTDYWHFHPETREIIGDRIADFIALEQGYDNVLDNPGDYPIYMLEDLDLKNVAGLTVNGNANHNIVVGSLGNDILTGGAGNDTLFGGAGVDEAHYQGNFNNYTLTQGTYLTVTDNVFFDGTDTLMHIERVIFADGVYENGIFTPFGGNHAPVAKDDNFSGNQDVQISGNLIADNGNGVDSDQDGDPLNVVPGTYATAHGSVTILANGDFVYTPNAGYFGPDTFNYTLQDGQGGGDFGTVNITLNQVGGNHNPVAQDDNFVGDQGVNITGNLLVNNGNGPDTDQDGNPLSVTPGTFATAHGSVTILANGDFTYTPTAGYYGPDTFNYTLLDGQGGNDIGAVNITLNQTTQDDTFVATLPAENFNGGAGNDTVDYRNSTGAVTVDLRTNTGSGGFAAGDTFVSIENLYGSDNSALRDNLYGDAGVNKLYGLAGDDTLQGGGGADILDGGAGRDYVRYKDSTAGVNVNLLTNVNTGGEAEGDQLFNIECVLGSNQNDTIRGGNGNDWLSGEKGDDLIAGGLGLDDLFGKEGADTFVFEAASAYAQSDKIRDFVLAQNDKIDITNLLSAYNPAIHQITDFVQITEVGVNSYLKIDADGGANNFVQIAIIENATGLTNVQALVASGNLIVPTAPANQPPVAQDDAFTGNQDTNITGNLLANNGNGVDSDPDNDPLSVTPGTYATAHGSVTILANGDFTYTPNAGYFGPDTFDYTLLDNQSHSDIGTVTLTVNQVIPNGPPVAQDDVFTGDQDTVITGNLLVNNGNGPDTDPDNDPLSVVPATFTTSHGQVVIFANGDFTYTPSAGYFGPEMFNYTVLDGQGHSDTGRVDITVNQVLPNAPPVAQDDNFTGNQDVNILGNLLANNGNGVDSDPDSDPLSVTPGTYATAHGSVTILANGDFTYTPNAGYYGSDTFDYTLLDNHSHSDTGTVSLTLNQVSQDDTFFATLPAENFNGGAGNDTVSYINSTGAVTIDLLLHTATGSFAAGDTFISIENLIGSNLVALKDTLKGDDGVNSLYGLAGDDTLFGNGGNDYLYGGDGVDTLSGDNGNDTLYGDAGNDTLKGRDGDDSLFGGEGNDYLEGGNNNDTLYGGGGADTLKGSAGVDTFVFQSMSDAGDTIQDFNRTAGEKIDISDILSGAYDPFTDAITDFVQILDNGLNSVLSIDITGTATNFVQVATILNVTGLTDEQALVNNGTLIVV